MQCNLSRTTCYPTGCCLRLLCIWWIRHVQHVIRPLWLVVACWFIVDRHHRGERLVPMILGKEILQSAELARCQQLCSILLRIGFHVFRVSGASKQLPFRILLLSAYHDNRQKLEPAPRPEPSVNLTSTLPLASACTSADNCPVSRWTPLDVVLLLPAPCFLRRLKTYLSWSFPWRN